MAGEEWVARFRKGPGGPLGPEVVVTDSHIRGGDYSGLRLNRFYAGNCRFTDGNFTNMRVRDVSWGGGVTQTVFEGCVVDGSRLDMQLGFVRFENCSFRDVTITHFCPTAMDLIDCVFTGSITEAVLNGKIVWPPRRERLGRTRNEYRGNDFSQARLEDVSFRYGIDLRLQKLPAGPDYLYVEDGAAGIQRARRVIRDWPDAEDRRQGEIALGLEQDLIDDGQEQLFMQRTTYVHPPALPWQQFCAAFQGDQ